MGNSTPSGILGVGMPYIVSASGVVRTMGNGGTDGGSGGTRSSSKVLIGVSVSTGLFSNLTTATATAISKTILNRLLLS